MTIKPLIRSRAVWAVVGAGTLAATAFTVTAEAAPAHTAKTWHHMSWHQLCAAPGTDQASGTEQASCDVLQVDDPAEPVAAFGVTAGAAPSGYGPADLLSAYNLPANGGSGQTIAVIDADDDPNAAGHSYQENGWGVYGGTSAATPVIAGVYADAGAPSAGSNPASFPYANPGALNDVTSGNDGSCSPSYLCTAQKGYDGPTGLGTPNGTAAFHS